MAQMEYPKPSAAIVASRANLRPVNRAGSFMNRNSSAAAANAYGMTVVSVASRIMNPN